MKEAERLKGMGHILYMTKSQLQLMKWHELLMKVFEGAWRSILHLKWCMFQKEQDINIFGIIVGDYRAPR